MKTPGLMLDGNAAAGLLASVFAFDATMAVVTCATCGNSGPIAELHLYGTPTAAVLRCGACDAVNIRLLETDATIRLDVSGVARLDIDLSN